MTDNRREQQPKSPAAGLFAAAGDDLLSAVWACLVCYWKGMFREMRHEGTVERPNVRCPRCGGDDVVPADGSSHVATVYFGEIGTRH